MLSKLIWLSCFISFNLTASDKVWLLVKNQSGISVYERMTPSGYIEIKAQMQLKSDQAHFIALLNDTKNVPMWFDRATKVTVLNKSSESEYIVHTQFDLTWPVKNRDMVTYSNYEIMADGSLKIWIEDSDYLKPIANYVRIRDVKAHWLLEDIAENKMQITYQAYADPQGDIPQWLSNSMTTNSVFKTFKNLRKQLIPITSNM